MNALLLERSLSGRGMSLAVDSGAGSPLLEHRGGLSVERLRWDIQGGPLDGVVEVCPRQGAEAAGLAFEDLARLLRCEVRITATDGSPAWWGYVWGVQTETLQMDMGEVWNRIAVQYRDESPSPSMSGYPWMTAFAEDSDSVRQYGYKERVITMDQARPGEPEAVRAAELVRSARPRWKPRTNPPSPSLSLEGRGTEGGGARLLLRGWWDTLGWQYYSQTSGYLGNTAGLTVQNLGDVAGNTMVAQSVVPATSWRLRDVWLRAGRWGTPADNLVVGLYTNVAGAPGALLDSGLLAGASVTGGVNWNRFNMSGYSLAAGTTYWIRASRSGALSAANYYRLGVDEGAGYAAGSPLLWNGGAWAALGGDVCFTMNGEQDTAAQVAAIVQGSQFFAGCLALVSSGLLGRQYRDGSRSGAAEAAELLAMGTSSGGRLVCLVGPERIARISAEPVLESSLPAFEMDGGKPSTGYRSAIRGRDGWPAENGSQVVGKVAAVRGVTQNAGRGAWSPYVLIKGAEWTREGGLQARW